MARIPFRQSLANPYHTYGRCLNRQWFDVPMPVVWEIMCDYLYFIHHAYAVEIYAFVLMNNHFHMMISAPKGNLSSAMQYFMNQTSRSLAKESKRINQIWGSRFGRCEIVGAHHALNTYKYIYRNPVPEVVQNVEDYTYSTLGGLLGRNRLTIPLVEDLTLFSDIDGTLNWLNAQVTLENQRAMQLALRRRVFELPKLNQKSHPLETNAL